MIYTVSYTLWERKWDLDSFVPDYVLFFFSIDNQMLLLMPRGSLIVKKIIEVIVQKTKDKAT